MPFLLILFHGKTYQWVHSRRLCCRKGSKCSIKRCSQKSQLKLQKCKEVDKENWPFWKGCPYYTNQRLQSLVLFDHFETQVSPSSRKRKSSDNLLWQYAWEEGIYRGGNPVLYETLNWRKKRSQNWHQWGKFTLLSTSSPSTDQLSWLWTLYACLHWRIAHSSWRAGKFTRNQKS